ncbi:MAG: hypothetical protein LBU32_16185 [Clostridiales bacterium]|jgi:hypothetical protein|nr:hypothetical protein [Clostridiales bacterium]
MKKAVILLLFAFLYTACSAASNSQLPDVQTASPMLSQPQIAVRFESLDKFNAELDNLKKGGSDHNTLNGVNHPIAKARGLAISPDRLA